MITKKEFESIDIEVKKSLEDAFDFLKDTCVEHNYVLYLADGEFKEKYNYTGRKFSPYVIDNREDKYKDESRLKFFIEFMRTFYSFPKNVDKTDDNEYRITMELMIYTHIWESKPFLKQLYRIADLANGQSYDWEVQVPDMTKHTFIRNQIRDVLQDKGLHLANIISKGFHTSLRNAFAHSEYQINENYKYIYLDTYKGDPSWDIESISFDEWTKRFVYSALLSYHFINIRVKKRKELIHDFGKDEFLITHPINKSRFRTLKIYYDEQYDNFSFHRRN